MARKTKKDKIDLSVPYVPEEDGKKPKKKRSGGMLAFVVLLGLVVLVVGATSLTIFFDIGNLRTKAVQAGASLDPEAQQISDQLQKREEAVEIREQSVETQREANDAEEQRLAALAAQLRLREDNLSSEEENRIPLYRRLKGQDEEDMKSLSKTYSLMDSAKAAELLAALGKVDDAAAILYFMKESNRAQILAQMETNFAAQITNVLLYN